MPSIPKVRASSGTIGTTRSPMFLSLISVFRMRTNAMVVEIFRSPVPSSCLAKAVRGGISKASKSALREGRRSEEHTSELQSRGHLVCRLLLEKKKNKLDK